MIKGTLYFSSNVEATINAMRTGYKVISLTEDEGISGSLKGTILLPPYQAVMAEMDNNFIGFQNEYTIHLMKKESDFFISMIVMALFRGENIIIFIPKDESKLMFVEGLIGHLSSYFGIFPGSEVRPFYYDISFNPIILSKFYIYDLIPKEDFILWYPPQVELYPETFYKLSNEFGLLHLKENEARAFLMTSISGSNQADKFLMPAIMIGD